MGCVHSGDQMTVTGLAPSSDWSFELARGAQLFICETWRAPIERAPEAARRFCQTIPNPTTPSAKAILRSTLIEISARWGYSQHLAVKARCSGPHCAPQSLMDVGRIWSGNVRHLDEPAPTEKEIFLKWVDSFSAELQRTHPKRLAERVAALIIENLAQSFSIRAIAPAVGAHQASIRRAFHREFQMSPREFHIRARVERASNMLNTMPVPKIEPVGLALGWQTKKGLYHAVRKIRGCTPGALRRSQEP